MTAPAARCAWPGCQVTAGRGRLMCRPHWYRVPKALRDDIWAYYTPGQTALTCSPAYRDALGAVLAWARQAEEEAAEREADLRCRQGTLFGPEVQS